MKKIFLGVYNEEPEKDYYGSWESPGKVKMGLYEAESEEEAIQKMVESIVDKKNYIYEPNRFETEEQIAEGQIEMKNDYELEIQIRISRISVVAMNDAPIDVCRHAGGN